MGRARARHRCQGRRWRSRRRAGRGRLVALDVERIAGGRAVTSSAGATASPTCSWAVPATTSWSRRRATPLRDDRPCGPANDDARIDGEDGEAPDCERLTVDGRRAPVGAAAGLDPQPPVLRLRATTASCRDGLRRPLQGSLLRVVATVSAFLGGRRDAVRAGAVDDCTRGRPRRSCSAWRRPIVRQLRRRAPGGIWARLQLDAATRSAGRRRYDGACGSWSTGGDGSPRAPRCRPPSPPRSRCSRQRQRQRQRPRARPPRRPQVPHARRAACFAPRWQMSWASPSRRLSRLPSPATCATTSRASADGRIVVSNYPLRARGEGGVLRPLDLSLRLAGDEIVPATRPSHSRSRPTRRRVLARPRPDARDHRRAAGARRRARRLDAARRPARRGRHAARDGHAPASERQRDRERSSSCATRAPRTSFRWSLRLAAGQSLVARGGGAAVVDPGGPSSPCFRRSRATRTVADVAARLSVTSPTTIEVQVDHRAAGVRYPVISIPPGSRTTTGWPSRAPGTRAGPGFDEPAAGGPWYELFAAARPRRGSLPA